MILSKKDRATMTIANYEGMARVKFGLKKRGQKGTEFKPDPSMRGYRKNKDRRTQLIEN